jgi:hypothetical protein
VSRRPRLTVRTRLTLLYTSLFAVCGMIVVAVSYILVAQLGTPDQGQESSSPVNAPTRLLALCHSAEAHHNERVIAKCNAYFRQQGAQHQRDVTLSHLLEYSLITLGVVIALAAILGWIAAGRALRPVHRITAAARAASEHNLSARVSLSGPATSSRSSPRPSTRCSTGSRPLWLTVTVAAALLLLGSLSGRSPVTLAALTRLDGAPSATWTVYERLADPPAASVPNEQVTTLAAAEQPGSAETNDSPAGSVSVATTFVSASPPLLVAVNV